MIFKFSVELGGFHYYRNLLRFSAIVIFTIFEQLFNSRFCQSLILSIVNFVNCLFCLSSILFNCWSRPLSILWIIDFVNCRFCLSSILSILSIVDLSILKILSLKHSILNLIPKFIFLESWNFIDNDLKMVVLHLLGSSSVHQCLENLNFHPDNRWTLLVFERL